MTLETVIRVSSSNIKYGFGATKELGADMKELRARGVGGGKGNELGG
jgi:hypothetical protein